MYSFWVFVDAFEGVISFDGFVDIFAVDVFDNATRSFFSCTIFG